MTGVQTCALPISQYGLRFSSQKICDDLQKLGIHRQKGRITSPYIKQPYSITKDVAKLEPPPISNKDLILPYIKGFFEGDGCLTWCNDSQRWTYSCGNDPVVLEWIHYYLHKFGIVKKSLKISNGSTKNHFNIVYQQPKDIISLSYWMRYLKTPCTMNRKWYAYIYQAHRDDLYYKKLASVGGDVTKLSKRYAQTEIRDIDMFEILE